MIRDLRFDIEDLLKDFYNGLTHTRKAGVWQGIDSFKDYNMKVIRDAKISGTIPKTIEELTETVSPDLPWAEEHFNERISGLPLNPGKSYLNWPYAKFKENNDEFKNESEQFSHTYMERFWPKMAGNILGIRYDNELGFCMSKKELFITDTPKDSTHPPMLGIRYHYGDLNDVINQLRVNKLTRQAYLPIFFPEDTGAVHGKRVPCTLGYLFEIWDNKLDITYYIRSIDVYRHLRNDIYLACRLTQHISTILEIDTGTINMYMANAHLFENDFYNFTKKEQWLKTSD